MSAPGGETPILEFLGVGKTYRVKPLFGRERVIGALRDVTFSLAPGRALALVGESGSGKTTCGRVAAGIVAPTAGRIRFRGRDLAGLSSRSERHALRRAVQMVFQDPFSALNPTHTVRHHLARPLRLHRGVARGAALETEVRRILGEVELDPDATIGRYPHELSGGQRQRVNLARALAVGAELIVADEPTSMLDVSIRRSVLDLMRRLKDQRGLSLLYITHDIATARYVAEETAVMFAGQIVEWGPSEAVVAHPRHPYSQLLLSAVPDPSHRLAPDAAAGLALAEHADRVRRIAGAPAGAAVEVAPGHFLRPSPLDPALAA